MMKKLFASSVAIFSLMALGQNAQAEGVKAGPTISGEANIVLPTGDFGDAFDTGFGATGTFTFPITSQIAITGRTGLVYHSADFDGSLIVVPLLGGINYSLSPSENSVFFAGELGFNWMQVSADLPGGGETENTETELGMSLAAGYRFGDIKAKGGLMFYELGEAGDSMSLFATIGYDFYHL